MEKLTSSTAQIVFPKTNMPTADALRLGLLRMLCPDAPHFTTWYIPGPKINYNFSYKK